MTGAWARAVLGGAAIVYLAGCGGGKNPARGAAAGAELSEEELYARGKEQIEAGRLLDARSLLRRYEQRYPRGPHVEEVKLLIADSFFKSNELDQRVEGVALYRQYLTFYPQHPLACTAQFRIAEYHLDQMRSCERDQTETRQAVDELQKLLAAYPDCPLAETARARLQEAWDRLACAEIKVAEYYKRTGEPVAAEHRLADLLRTFPSIGQRCYALRLHVEVLATLGKHDRAREQLAVMEESCPADEDLREARKRAGVAPVVGGGGEGAPR